MDEFCDAKIRPMPNDIEVACGLTGEHHEHQGVLRDYAYPGSATTVYWQEDDRRTFRGQWAPCAKGNCVLPNEHAGRCAQ